LHGFITPIEQHVASRQRLPAELLQGRAKAGLLEADLERCEAVLGPISRRVCGDLPRMETEAQAAGVMYVLEGSTLGGQVIARHVRRIIGPDAPCAYHQSYGALAHAKWEEFRVYLRGIEPVDDQQTAIMSARETFTKLEAWAKTWSPHAGTCAT
jgi:heme oxygenase (biliverdin-IX-beta and delta-forming)